MKSATALLQEAIDASFEALDLDETGKYVEKDKAKVAESYSRFHNFFLEHARRSWVAKETEDLVEDGLGGLGMPHDIQAREQIADPSKFSFDMTMPLGHGMDDHDMAGMDGMDSMGPGAGSPMGAAMPAEPGMAAGGPGGLPPEDPSMTMPHAPGAPGANTFESLFDDLEESDFSDVFSLREFGEDPMEMGNDPMGHGHAEEDDGLGFGDLGMEDGTMGLPGEDEMAPVGGDMGGDMGGEPGGDLGGMDSGMGDGDGMEFHFDVNSLGFGDDGIGGEAGDDMSGGMDGGIGGEIGGDMDGDELGGDMMGGDMGGEPGDDMMGGMDAGMDGGMGHKPAMAAMPAKPAMQRQPGMMPMESKGSKSKMNVVPKGKPRATKARAGLPKGKN